MPSLSRPFRRRLLLVALILPAAIVATLELLYSQNTLYLNDQWIVQKRMLQMGLMGADEYLMTRTALTRNRLNLGPYYGFQEVIQRASTQPQAVQFSFRLAANSYLDFTFNRSRHHFAGFRLSRSSQFPTQEFESDDDGRFTLRRPLTLPEVREGWHWIRIENQNGDLRLKLDDNAEVSVSSHFLPGQLGLRAGFTGAEIGAFDVRDSDGKWVHSSFANTRRWAPTLIFNILLFYLIAWGLSRLIAPRSLITDRRKLFSWILVGAMCFFCVLIFYAFDVFYYSALIHADNGITRSLNADDPIESAPLETARHRFFESWSRRIGGETLSLAGLKRRGYSNERIWSGPIFCDKTCTVEHLVQIPPAKDSHTYRTLFIGTSQTLGAGATTLMETFFARIHYALRAQLAPKFLLESLNASVSGSTAPSLHKEIHKRYPNFVPDLVVINLSNNDHAHSTLPLFEATMRDWIEEFQKSGTRILLLEEANTKESPESLSAFHATLRELGRRYAVPVRDLDGYLADPARLQSGTLWWDFVHLTSYGQAQVADWLAPQLLVMLRQAPPLR